MYLQKRSRAIAAFLALATAGVVHGQFRYNPAAPGVVAGTQGAAVIAPGYRPANFNYCPNGWNPYWYPPGYGAAGGYLNGVSQVYNAMGQYQIDHAQANLINQQARQAGVDTRRKINDEFRYEQSLLPNNEDLRQRDQMNASRRARNDPPPAEVWSGAAMNTLLKDILNFEGQSGLRGPQIPLDQDIVGRLNVTTGTTNGSVSLIREGQKLTWPPVLQKDDFDASRNLIDALLPRAVEIVKQGGGKNDPLTKLLAELGSMKKSLDTEVANFTADEWIGGTRFINQLRESAKLLQKPNAANYFNGKWVASGTTVGEMIYNMGQKGLTFAPCAEGDEDAYNVAYRLMVNYDAGLNRYRSGR